MTNVSVDAGGQHPPLLGGLCEYLQDERPTNEDHDDKSDGREEDAGHLNIRVNWAKEGEKRRVEQADLKDHSESLHSRAERSPSTNVSFYPSTVYPGAMADASESSTLWFERLYAYLRLPFWAGALLFGVGLPIAIALMAIAAGDLWGHLPLVIVVAIYGGMGLFTQVAARTARRRVEGIDEYTKSMRQGNPLNIGPLYSRRMAFLTFVGLELVVRPLYIFYGLSPGFTLAQRILVGLPFIYVDLFAYTFVWVLAYSFYAIYKVGQMELSLKPFTEDHSLGLNPLGRLALMLTGLYLLFLLFNLLPNVLSGILAAPILAFQTFLGLLAFAFFFLPLLPLRQKLNRTRRDLHAQLSPRLTRLYATINEESEGGIQRELVNELTLLKAMEEDIHQIYRWPFDTGVVVRLSVIVFSTTAITLSQVIATFFGL